MLAHHQKEETVQYHLEAMVLLHVKVICVCTGNNCHLCKNALDVNGNEFMIICIEYACVSML